jgi:hypothetical protein
MILSSQGDTTSASISAIMNVVICITSIILYHERNNHKFCVSPQESDEFAVRRSVGRVCEATSKNILAELKNKKSKNGGVRELWSIIFAMKDAKSASSRSRIKKTILERFPDLQRACDWLEKEVEVVANQESKIAKKRIDVFASHVQRITHGKLKLASKSTHAKYLSKEGLEDHGTIVFIKS